MITLYNLINTPENLSLIIKLIKNQIIMDATIIHHINIYERFYQLTGNKGEKYKELGLEFHKHPNSIQRIISKLNKMVK